MQKIWASVRNKARSPHRNQFAVGTGGDQQVLRGRELVSEKEAFPIKYVAFASDTEYEDMIHFH